MLSSNSPEPENAVSPIMGSIPEPSKYNKLLKHEEANNVKTFLTKQPEVFINCFWKLDIMTAW